jgi:outer membrane protein TolC
VWGRIRRQVESNVSGAQVSAADLANAKLSGQGTLATDYFNLRAEDSLEQLLADTVAGYRRALQITKTNTLLAPPQASIMSQRWPYYNRPKPS